MTETASRAGQLRAASRRDAPVAPVVPSRGALRPLGIGEVELLPGFWADRQEVNRAATLRVSLARRSVNGGYVGARGAATIAKAGTSVFLRPTGSWNGNVIPPGIYRLRFTPESGAHKDLVLRFR